MLNRKRFSTRKWHAFHPLIERKKNQPTQKHLKRENWREAFEILLYYRHLFVIVENTKDHIAFLANP